MKPAVTLFLVLSFMLFASFAFAQNDEYKRFNEYNMQPEVWHFPGPVEGGVGATGDLNLSIPVMNVPGTNGFGFDIAFSYKAGIKLHQPASWIGLGWNFDPASITRDVQGNLRLDNTNYGVDYNSDTHTFDNLPDAYQVTLPGRGTMTMMRTNFASFNEYDDSDFLVPDRGDSSFHFLEYNGYKVDFTLSTATYDWPGPFGLPLGDQNDGNSDNNDIIRWKVTTNDGVRYYFGMPSLAVYKSYLLGETVTPFYYPNAWRLLAIAGPNCNAPESDLYSETVPSAMDSEIDWVKFEYGFDEDSTFAWRATSETDIFMNIYLKKVVTPTHQAEFITSGRADKDLTSRPSGIDLSPYYLKLDTLRLTTRSGTVVKQAVLDSDYELGEYGAGTNSGKLTLKQIKFLGADGGVMPGYEFLYLDGDDNPSWLLAADENYFRYDGWGYYNDTANPRLGIDNNTTDARAWSLRKIVFPTGGTEEYILENDHISTNTVDARFIYSDGSSAIKSFNFDSFGGNVCRRQGGVRVKRITRTNGLGDTMDIVYTYGPGIVPTIPFKLVPHWTEAEAGFDDFSTNEFHTYQRGITDIHYQWVKKQYFGTPANPFSTETTHYLTGHLPNVVLHEQTTMWTLHMDNNDVFGGVPWGTVVKTERVRNTDKDVVEYYHDLSTNRVMASFVDDLGNSAYDYTIRQVAPRVTKELAYTTYAYSGNFGLKTLVTTDRTYDEKTLQIKSESVYSSSELKRKELTYAYEIDEYGGTTWDPATMSSTSVRGLNLLTLPVQTANFYGDLLAPSLSETCEEEFPINPTTISVHASGASSPNEYDSELFTFLVDQFVIWEAKLTVDERNFDEAAYFEISEQSSGDEYVSIVQFGTGIVDTSGALWLPAGTYELIATISGDATAKPTTSEASLEYKPDRHEYPLSLISANTITYKEENYDFSNNWRTERVYKMNTEADICIVPDFNEWDDGVGSNDEEWQLAFKVLDFDYGVPIKYQDANGSTLELFYGDNENNLSYTSNDDFRHAYLTGIELDNTLTREFDYDTTHFQVNHVTDENGHVSQFKLDEFGRLIKSLDADTNIVATYGYEFERSVGDTSISAPNHIRTTLHYSDNDSTSSYDFYDGRAVKIQSALRGDTYDYYQAQSVDMMGRAYSTYKTYRKTQVGTHPIYDSLYKLREELGDLAAEETDRHTTSTFNSWFDKNVTSVKFPGAERPDNMNYVSRSRVLAEDTLSSFYSVGDDVVWSTVESTNEEGQVSTIFTDEFGKERMRQIYPPGGGAMAAYATTVNIHKDVRDTLEFTVNVQQDVFYDYTISAVPFDSPWNGKAVFKIEDINGNVEFADSTEDPDQDIISASGEISDLAAGTYRMVGRAIASENCKTESSGTIRLDVNEEISTTYFEYDGQGNIKNVYSPNYFDVPDGSSSEHWVTSYSYNTLNQLVERTSPDAGTSRYKYDLNGNVRFSEDANQNLNSLVAYNSYDYNNRPVDFGVADTAFTALDPESTYNFESKDYNLISTNHYDDGNWPNAYPWNRFDTTGITLNNLNGRLVANLYRIAKAEGTLVLQDMHYTGTSDESNPGEIETAPDSVVVDSNATVTFTAGEGITLGPGFDARPGSSFDATIDQNLGIGDHVWQLTLYSYDNKGQVEKKYIITEDLADSTVLSYTYNRQGLVTKQVSEHGSDQFYHWYEYDVLGRLTNTFTNTSDSKPSLADVAYEYTVGGLVSKTRYNEESSGVFGTTLTNTYNIRDWLTDINDVETTSEKFAAQYEYTPKGNIKSATFYQDESALTGQKKYKYDYGYDFLNRLTDADYSYDNGSAWQTTSAFDVDNISFDAIGNILSLDRRDDSGTLIDELDYTYGASNSRLAQVADNHTATTEDWDAEDVSFEYDANGNVIKMMEANHGSTDRVLEFDYDQRNLPTKLSLTDDGIDQTIHYRYNSDGKRVYKKVGTNTAEYYLMDGSQNIAVYKDASLSYFNLFASGLEGRLELSGSEKHFYVKDHLGSTRLVFNDQEVVQESYDFYPFGLVLPNRSAGTVSTKELFTGKERDGETNLDYFGARYYSASIGRWIMVDPLADKRLYLSPYNYVQNNPIDRFDPDGKIDWKSKLKAAFDRLSGVPGDQSNYSPHDPPSNQVSNATEAAGDVNAIIQDANDYYKENVIDPTNKVIGEAAVAAKDATIVATAVAAPILDDTATGLAYVAPFTGPAAPKVAAASGVVKGVAVGAKLVNMGLGGDDFTTQDLAGDVLSLAISVPGGQAVSSSTQLAQAVLSDFVDRSVDGMTPAPPATPEAETWATSADELAERVRSTAQPDNTSVNQ